MKLLLADDHALFRKGLLETIKLIFPQCSIHQVNSWDAVHQSLQEFQFDLLLLDIFMPRQKTWEQELTTLISQHPTAAICIVSASTEKAHLQMALKIGVKGFICKTAEPHEIKQALLQITQGKTYFSSPLWETATYSTPRLGSSQHLLTHRQQDILRLMANGDSNKIIARKLDLAESTVKKHVYNICQTFHAKNRVEAITAARQHGWLFLYD